MSHGHWCPTARHFDFEDSAYRVKCTFPCILSASTISCRRHQSELIPGNPRFCTATNVWHPLSDILTFLVTKSFSCLLASFALVIKVPFVLYAAAQASHRFCSVRAYLSVVLGFIIRLLRSLLTRLSASYCLFSLPVWASFGLMQQCRQASFVQPVWSLDVCHAQFFSTVSRIFLF